MAERFSPFSHPSPRKPRPAHYRGTTYSSTSHRSQILRRSSAYSVNHLPTRKTLLRHLFANLPSHHSLMRIRPLRNPLDKHGPFLLNGPGLPYNRR